MTWATWRTSTCSISFTGSIFTAMRMSGEQAKVTAFPPLNDRYCGMSAAPTWDQSIHHWFATLGDIALLCLAFSLGSVADNHFTTFSAIHHRMAVTTYLPLASSEFCTLTCQTRILPHPWTVYSHSTALMPCLCNAARLRADGVEDLSWKPWQAGAS